MIRATNTAASRATERLIHASDPRECNCHQAKVLTERLAKLHAALRELAAEREVFPRLLGGWF